MLIKLALSGMKSKLKDYIVLLLGLVMSISIFYMFETLALNKAFIEKNSLINSITPVFQIGSVLLAIITVAYSLYANSFLFSLRQKEFGMYMTLGAKKRKISLIMFIETIVIGLISLIIGLIVGVILANVVGQVLMKQLDFHSTTYAPFYLISLLVTIIFFFILFLISALVNILQLSKVSALDLVHGEHKAEHIIIRKKAVILKAVLSLILLGIGYYAMIDIKNTRIIGMVIALITITAGTYLFFSTLLPLVIHKMREKQIRRSKKINSFTYAQLSFRINSLTRVLATVAMLVALGMGAIAVGFAFKNNSLLFANNFTSYDVTITNPTTAQNKLIADLDKEESFQYQYKRDSNKIYFNRTELAKHKPLYIDELSKDKIKKNKRLMSNPEINETKWQNFLRSAFPSDVLGNHDLDIVSIEDFQKRSGQKGQIVFVKVRDFNAAIPVLKKINQLEKEKHKNQPDYYDNNKYAMYETYSGFANGTVFMGFFLGFAFLAMMASCLMFKILTGATNDKKRYQMLTKIGVRRKLLTKSIYKEIFFIFLFPAIIGFIHVTIGMKMFNILLIDTYYRFYVPVLLFLIIYTLYYFITVKLYREIVLRQKN
ncbi:ABC transporter permease [Listeria sp. PSOL-1]|uniref:ABC transporter permease n=1 Tax=Listeria sp. PSOL-1 TaxID=1844999 RepID=UPI0013D8BC6B|nr:ABC transporter permease [Listeria sp. PSOL-1]